MAGYKQECKRQKRAKRPVDAARLQEMALAYVARYATSSVKLERYLLRKLREHGWADGEDTSPDIAGLVRRYVDLGYIDDEAFARAKSGSLMRRGYGKRRVNEALGHDGISSDIREDIAPGEAQQRHAVLAMARKRRFGPFALEAPERDKREKQIAALLRAGHTLDSVRKIMDAASPEDAELWAHELDEEEPNDF